MLIAASIIPCHIAHFWTLLHSQIRPGRDVRFCLLELCSDAILVSPNGLLDVAGVDNGRLRILSMVDCEEVAQVAGQKGL
jgi:hypothetical protein